MITAQLLAGPPMRFSDLECALPDISQNMLTQQLRALEEDRIVSRTIYAQGLMGIESGRFASSVGFGLSSRMAEDAERSSSLQKGGALVSGNKSQGQLRNWLE
jgi:hypothetical protein